MQVVMLRVFKANDIHLKFHVSRNWLTLYRYQIAKKKYQFLYDVVYDKDFNENIEFFQFDGYYSFTP